MRTATLLHRAFRPEFREQDALPAGVCGRMAGVALTYNVVDAYGTRFAPGCMERTKREKVPARKVRLYVDHEAGVRSHVGYITDMATSGIYEIMTADIFDTEEGRRTKEYLGAVLAAGAETGLSIGFYSREASSVLVDGEEVYEFREIELDEISITPRPAVPGAAVTDVRAMGVQTATAIMRQSLTLLDVSTVRALVRARFGDAVWPEATDAAREADRDATAPDTQATERTSEAPATMDERIAALRRTY